jgi:hypothetical protein
MLWANVKYSKIENPVQIRLPPQSPERGQEIWLCIRKQISFF